MVDSLFWVHVHFFNIKSALNPDQQKIRAEHTVFQQRKGMEVQLYEKSFISNFNFHFFYSVVHGETQGDRVRQNWSKLEEGMSYDEVEKLVGPICGENPYANKVCNEFRDATKGMGMASKIQTNYYYVEFDKNNKSIKWSLK
ncbi:MAG: hypothetical protein KBA28_10875 [Syntrophaceae bacterium]|nr:hypothetical protein [Syntrophaceae bacterium]